MSLAASFQTTHPWSKYQFIVIDGRPFVYHGEPNAAVVRFPGGGSKTVQELRSEGRAIHMPSSFRYEQESARKNVPELRKPHGRR